VKDVKEDVLGEVALGQQPHRAIAQNHYARCADARTPWLHEVVDQTLEVKPALSHKVGNHAVIVVKVGLEVSTAQAERQVEAALIERNPMPIDPLLVRQPRVPRARGRQTVVGNACRSDHEPDARHNADDDEQPAGSNHWLSYLSAGAMCSGG
jgi:hypothetical protein